VSGWSRAQYLRKEMKRKLKGGPCVPLSDKIRDTCDKSSVIVGTAWNGISFIRIELLRADTVIVIQRTCK
jgi:hypothetical protein